MSLNGIKDRLKDIGDFNFIYKSLFSLKNFFFIIFFKITFYLCFIFVFHFLKIKNLINE
jgi:hypothetical protein